MKPEEQSMSIALHSDGHCRNGTDPDHISVLEAPNRLAEVLPGVEVGQRRVLQT